MKRVERQNAPFVKIIVPAALGILLSRLVDVSWQVVGGCFVIVLLFAILLRKREGMLPSIYVWVSIVLFFFGVGEFQTPRSNLPAGERVAVTVQVAEPLHSSGRWQRTTADVGSYRLSGHRADVEGTEDEQWHKVNERLMLYIDTCFHNIEVGTQLAFRGWFNPIDTTNSSYGNLMRMRGLHGRIYLTSGNLLWRSPHISKTPTYYAAKMQSVAIERLERLNLSADNRAVVTAMTAGDKRSVDRELRASYSTTGAAHLLAVSGLHVGIVFVLINLLLYLLPIFRRGHIVKNVVAIVAIWLYAMSAGLAPSVIRAALMFSFAQVALATSTTRSALNIMLGSAVIMLAINPNYATDPSFLLSYSAVLSILLFFNPLYRLVALPLNWNKSQPLRKLANMLISVMVVGFVATMGTAPLVAYWFGNLPIVGLLLNPIVIFTAHIIVMFGVLWIVMPIAWLNPLFSLLLTASAGLQNWVVDRSAALSWASLSAHPPLWLVVVIYAIYLTLALYLSERGRRRELFVLE